MCTPCSPSPHATLARRCALRAAHAVTIFIAAATLGGCGSATIREADNDAASPDTHTEASVSDVSIVARDAETADTGGDAGPNCSTLRGPTDGGVDAYLQCCGQNGWDPRRGCEAWGPFMPPEIEV